MNRPTMEGPPMFKTTGFSKQLLASLSACLMMVACGTSIGWASPALVKLNSSESKINMTSAEAAWMVAIIEVGILISPIPAGLMADRIGRKALALSIAPFYVVSWFIIFKEQTFLALCIARMIQGLATGVMFTVLPLYLGELASQRIRGSITSFIQIAHYLGLLYEYLIGPFVSYDVLALCSMMVPVVFLLLFVWQPESPHYCVFKGQEHRAMNALMRLRGTRDVNKVQDELLDLIASVQDEMDKDASFKDVIATPADRRALFIVQLVGTVAMMSGVVPITSYSTRLFDRTGFTSVSPDVLTIVMGVVLLLSAFLGAALIDLTGRRPLLIVSTMGCAFSLGMVSVFFYCYDVTDYDVSRHTWVSPVCIMLYNIFYAVGLDPVTLSYRSEMFPSRTRAKAASINTTYITVWGFISVKLFQIVTDNIGVYFIFLIFSSSCFVGAVWMYFYVIETKNKSFSQIHSELIRLSTSSR